MLGLWALLAEIAFGCGQPTGSTWLLVGGCHFVVGKVPATAGAQLEGSSHVGCMNHCVSCACVEDSCKVVAIDCSKVPSVSTSSSGFVRGMQCLPQIPGP